MLHRRRASTPLRAAMAVSAPRLRAVALAVALVLGHAAPDDTAHAGGDCAAGGCEDSRGEAGVGGPRWGVEAWRLSASHRVTDSESSTLCLTGGLTHSVWSAQPPAFGSSPMPTAPPRARELHVVILRRFAHSVVATVSDTTAVQKYTLSAESVEVGFHLFISQI